MRLPVALHVTANADRNWYVIMCPRQFLGIGFVDGDEHAFEIVHDEPFKQTIFWWYVYTLFLQFIKYGFGIGIKPAVENVLCLFGTFQLMSFHGYQGFEMSIT